MRIRNVSHDVTETILVFLNSDTAAMLSSKQFLWEVELFSLVKTFFCSNVSENVSENVLLAVMTHYLQITLMFFDLTKNGLTEKGLLIKPLNQASKWR